MALVKCPECSNDVSDKAISCPKCGHPFRTALPQPTGDLDAVLKQALAREGKIPAIKTYREYTGAGLAQAKEYVERLEAGTTQATVGKPSQPQGCSPIIVFGGMFILGCIAFVIWGSLSSLQPGDNSTPSPTPAPAIPSADPVAAPAPQSGSVAEMRPVARLPADVLYQEYKDNEVSADAAYKGKVMVITGAIRDIGKDILDSPYIVVGGQDFLDGVQCFFPNVKDSPLAYVSKGQKVTVRGRVAGKMGSVLMRECQFQ